MRIEQPFGELGLPDEMVPEPAPAQVRLDLQREGTLVWLLQQMVVEFQEYGVNILGADLKTVEVFQVIDWQARRRVLEQLLERMVTLTIGDESGN